MKPKKELQDELKVVEELIFTGAPSVKSYSEYTYLIGKRDTIVDVLKVKKRVKKDKGENKKLPEFGLKNPTAVAIPRREDI